MLPLIPAVAEAEQKSRAQHGPAQQAVFQANVLSARCIKIWNDNFGNIGEVPPLQETSIRFSLVHVPLIQEKM